MSATFDDFVTRIHKVDMDARRIKEGNGGDFTAQFEAQRLAELRDAATLERDRWAAGYANLAHSSLPARPEPYEPPANDIRLTIAGYDLSAAWVLDMILAQPGGPDLVRGRVLASLGKK
jgi:hypothetical protein